MADFYSHLRKRQAEDAARWLASKHKTAKSCTTGACEMCAATLRRLDPEGQAKWEAQEAEQEQRQQAAALRFWNAHPEQAAQLGIQVAQPQLDPEREAEAALAGLLAAWGDEISMLAVN